MPTWIYHMADVGNLRSILTAGQLVSLNSVHREGHSFTSIAYETLQDRRATKQVPCGPGGVLHDYVPFYFGPRSPMLFVIGQGRVASYRGGQRSVVHLATTVEAIQQTGARFVFTDGHAIMELSSFYEDVSDLTKVDWAVMKSKYWNDTPQNPDGSRRRQAEFLVHETVPWTAILGIGVMDDAMGEEVRALVAELGLTTPVKTKANWYY